MNRTSRTLAALATAAVLSTGLVATSSTPATAAPSQSCKQARADVQTATRRAANATDEIQAIDRTIVKINRRLSTLGDSARDRRERASLKQQRAQLRRQRADVVGDRRVFRHQRAEARNRVQRFC